MQLIEEIAKFLVKCKEEEGGFVRLSFPFGRITYTELRLRGEKEPILVGSYEHSGERTNLSLLKASEELVERVYDHLQSGIRLEIGKEQLEKAEKDELYRVEVNYSEIADGGKKDKIGHFFITNDNERKIWYSSMFSEKPVLIDAYATGAERGLVIDEVRNFVNAASELLKFIENDEISENPDEVTDIEA